jgi:hypothetical protein
MSRIRNSLRKIASIRPNRRLLVFSATTLVLMAVLGYGASAIEYQNIFTDYSKPFSHFAPPGKHSDTESYKYNPSLGFQGNIDRRHANCNDCHDPHSATRSPSPLGSYFGAGTQANVSGVKPLYWNKAGVAVVPAGTAPTYAFVSSVVKEYELCFKCHSSYAFDFAGYKTTYGRDLTFDWTTRTYVPNGTLVPDASHINVPETDIAMEFNPLNSGYHPVLAHGKTDGNQSLPWADGRKFNETFMPGFSADSRIKCTDCHASDSTSVKGPHGSNNKYILKRRAPTEEPTITRTSYNLGSIIYGGGPAGAGPFPLRTSYNMTWYVRTDDVICYNCHDVKYFGPGKGHPSRAKHWQNCQWHRPIAMDEVGCASCKITPIHGAPTGRYMMLTKAQGWTTPNNPARYNPAVTNWCFNCHDFVPGQAGGYVGGEPSCPRFYSVDSTGTKHQETRVHFQSSRIKAGATYFIPLPTPDMENLKGLGNIADYRYYNRDDDYILFHNGTPETAGNQYKVRFDQPSTGDRPDGQPVAEVGYEDSISLFTLDHAKDTQVYLDVNGNAIATRDVRAARKATDNLGNDITDVVGTRTANTDDRSGWFSGHVGYGNTIDEIYQNGNSFTLDFGDLSQYPTIKLLWGVNEEKGAKLPVLVQTKDKTGKWVTRGSARHAEDRYGYLDIKSFFPAGTKDYQVKIIPTLNSVDYMAVSVKDSPVKKTVLHVKRADYYKGGAGVAADVTASLASPDKTYVTFDYLDAADLYFDIPASNKTLPRRDFVFAPVGYYETGGDIPGNATLDRMTAEKAQDYATLSPAGGYANHYNVQLLDPGTWNDEYASRIVAQ